MNTHKINCKWHFNQIKFNILTVIPNSSYFSFVLDLA